MSEYCTMLVTEWQVQDIAIGSFSAFNDFEIAGKHLAEMRKTHPRHDFQLVAVIGEDL